MELRHLRYFIAVAEELNFSRAAERLRLAQPSLSTQIRNLEDELGIRLLERDRNRVSLTDAGSVFLTEAKAVLRRAALAVARAHEAAEGHSGELHIGAISTLTMSFLPTSLSLFRQSFPNVGVTLVELSGQAQLDRLAKNQIHLGFIPAPFINDFERPETSSELLLQSPIMVVMNPNHPLAALKTVPLQKLLHETFLHIRLAQTEGQRIWTESICRKVGFVPRFGAVAETSENLLGMVAAGQGIAIIPKFNQRPSTPGFTFRPLADENLAFELYAIWNASSPSGLLKNFLNIAREEAHKVQVAIKNPVE